MATTLNDTTQLPVVVAPTPPRSLVHRRAGQIRGIAAWVLVALAGTAVGFLLFVFFLSGFLEARAQSGLERRFARPLSYGQALVGGRIPAGTPVARVDIPSIGVHQIVVEGTAADQLRYGPGHLPTSPLPGQVGNSVIAGHRLAWGGPFRRLGSLGRGSRVYVTTGQGHFVYVVEGHRTIPASDVAPLAATSNNRLTLITASDLSASNRVVVTADLVGPARPAPAGRPSVLAAADSGLAGQRGIGLQLFLWTELLVVVIALAILLYRRLPRTSSYLITTPVLLGVLWIVYENLGRLLPGTV